MKEIKQEEIYGKEKNHLNSNLEVETNYNGVSIKFSKIPSVIKEQLLKDDIEDISLSNKKLIIVTNTKKESVNLEGKNINEIINWIKLDLLPSAGKSLTPAEPIIDMDIMINSADESSDIKNMLGDKKMRFNILDQSIIGSGMTLEAQIRVNKYLTTLTDDMIKGFFPYWEDKVKVKFAQEGFDIMKNLISNQKSPNIIIAGATGTGKTEIQKWIIDQIPFEKRLMMIQDTNDTAISLLYPDKDIREIFTNSQLSIEKAIEAGLRQLPEYLAIAEIRGSEEAKGFISALNTGHAGITTLHADSGLDAITRISKLTSIPEDEIGNRIDYIFHVKRIIDENGNKSRVINEIVEYNSNTETNEVIYSYDTFIEGTTGTPYHGTKLATYEASQRGLRGL